MSPPPFNILILSPLELYHLERRYHSHLSSLHPWIRTLHGKYRHTMKRSSYEHTREQNVCDSHNYKWYSLIHRQAVCLTTGPKPLPKRALYTVRSSTSSFNLRYPVFSPRSSSSCICFLSRFPLSLSLYLSFSAVPYQEVTSPVSLPSFLFCIGYYIPAWLYNTSSFFTHSVRLICPFFLRHHITSNTNCYKCGRSVNTWEDRWRSLCS
jgi:hypothetical protein